MKQLFFLFLFSPATAAAQYLIEGTAPAAFRNGMAYLDVLDAHDEFRMITDEGMLLKTVFVDSTGNFQLTGNELTGDAYLLRLCFGRADDVPLQLNVARRHYLTLMTDGRDTFRTEGLRLAAGNPASRAINDLERRLDDLRPPPGTTTERQAELSTAALREVLQATLHADDTQEYDRVVALGYLDEPTPADLRAGEAAVGATPLPYSFSDAIDTAIGTREYERLRQENGRLKWWITGLAVLAGTLLGWVVILRRRLARTGNQPRKLIDVPVRALLSEKEREVMEWIAMGKSNKQIAERLFVAESTVKTHINNIYRKMGVSSRREALLRWGREGGV